MAGAKGIGIVRVRFTQDVIREDGLYEKGSEMDMSVREATEYETMGHAQRLDRLEEHEQIVEALVEADKADRERRAEEGDEEAKAQLGHSDAEYDDKSEGVPNREEDREADLRRDLEGKNKDELKSVADDRGVEYKNDDSKAQLVDKIAEDVKKKG